MTAANSPKIKVSELKPGDRVLIYDVAKGVAEVKEVKAVSQKNFAIKLIEFTDGTSDTRGNAAKLSDASAQDLSIPVSKSRKPRKTREQMIAERDAKKAARKLKDQQDFEKFCAAMKAAGHQPGQLGNS